jgi:hypothetical protein
MEDAIVTVNIGAARIAMVLDAALSATLVVARENVGPGWVSRGYHVRAASRAVVARARMKGAATIQTLIGWGGNTPI